MAAATPPPGSGVDPSMEDILASIRRILSEDDSEPAAQPPQPAAPAKPDVLALDASMLVDEPAPLPAPADAPRLAPPVAPPPLVASQALSSHVLAPSVMPSPAITMAPLPPAELEHRHLPPPEPPHVEPAPPPSATPDNLIGAAAAAAASSSVGSLLRTLASERQQVAVYRGGPTLEDLVRDEMRPLLKQWLDANLPPLVERLVRAEIERVVGRALS